MTPAFVNTSWVYVPIGTSGSVVTMTRSGSARSATPVMPFGLPGSTAISSEFGANTSGSPSLPAASVSFVMLCGSAEANTSAGAPSLIWATRSDDPAKLNVDRRRQGARP